MGFYIAFAVIVLVLLLSIQVYWLVGTNLLRNIDSLTEQQQQLYQQSGFATGKYQQEFNVLVMKLETNQETLMLWSKPINLEFFFSMSSLVSNFFLSMISSDSQTDVAKNRSEQKHIGLITFDAEDYPAKIMNLGEKLDKAKETLYPARYLGFDAESKELLDLYQKRVNDLIDELIKTIAQYEQQKNEYTRKHAELRNRYILRIMQESILPLLYGLLGAVAYVLRSLISDVQQATYTQQRAIHYGVRVFFGALVGPIIGYFIAPQGTAGLASLSPMALSFLVGYNMDVLFAAMDRLISTVRKQTLS